MELLQVVGQCEMAIPAAYQKQSVLVLATTPLPAEAHPRIVLKAFLVKAATSRTPGHLRKKASLLELVQ